MTDKDTEKEKIQESIRTAIASLNVAQRKKVLTFIVLLPHEWSAAINESVKALTLEQSKKVLEFVTKL